MILCLKIYYKNWKKIHFFTTLNHVVGFSIRGSGNTFIFSIHLKMDIILQKKQLSVITCPQLYLSTFIEFYAKVYKFTRYVFIFIGDEFENHVQPWQERYIPLVERKDVYFILTIFPKNFWNKLYLIWKPLYRAFRISKKIGRGIILRVATPP